MTHRLTVFGLLLAVVLSGCLSAPSADDEPLRAKIESNLRTRLAVGDPAEKIESVLREQGLAFSFDRFNSRYQSVFEPQEKRTIVRKVSILISVDDSRRLTKIEVTNSYTYL